MEKRAPESRNAPRTALASSARIPGTRREPIGWPKVEHVEEVLGFSITDP